MIFKLTITEGLHSSLKVLYRLASLPTLEGQHMSSCLCFHFLQGSASLSLFLSSSLIFRARSQRQPKTENECVSLYGAQVSLGIQGSKGIHIEGRHYLYSSTCLMGLLTGQNKCLVKGVLAESYTPGTFRCSLSTRIPYNFHTCSGFSAFVIQAQKCSEGSLPAKTRASPEKASPTEHPWF